MSELRWWLTPRGAPWVLAMGALAAILGAPADMSLFDKIMGALWAMVGGALGLLILAVVFRKHLAGGDR